MSQTLQPPPPEDLDKFERVYPDLGRWLRLLTALFKPHSQRNIGDAAGKNPAFENSWVNYNSSTHETAGFYKDSLSRVWLKGTIKSGTVPSDVFTLPEEYRPLLIVSYSSIDGTGVPSAKIIINTDGTVNVSAGNNSLISLDGISWRV